MTNPENKRQKAVALKYDTGEKAPHVIAVGAGEIAKKILELAKEHNIPIEENDSLVEILSKLEIGQQIPPETYRVVAEILAFLYRTDILWRQKQEEKFRNIKANSQIAVESVEKLTAETGEQ